MDIITIALYAILVGAYLLAIPAVILLYLDSRWYVASSIERLLMYCFVFMFFPGLLILSPFVNLRPSPREV